MRRNWIVRAALRAVPGSWRDAVRVDVEEEARAVGWRGVLGDLWCAWQILSIALPLQRSINGSALLWDFRYAVRSLVQAKGFAAGAVVTFALGIGVNVAVFASIDRMFFRSLPYANAEQLLLLRSCPTGGTTCDGSFPSPVAYALAHEAQTIAEVAAAGFPGNYEITRDANDQPPVVLIGVSPGLLHLLGVRPEIGRDLDERDRVTRQRVAWLSHDAWRARFGGRHDVLGRQLWRGNRAATIIGVLPVAFFPPAWTVGTPKWDGLVLDSDGDAWAAIDPSGRIAAPVARLKPGAARAAAQAEIDNLVRARWREWFSSRTSPPIVRADALESSLFSRTRRYMEFVAASAAMLLLIACANLAGLMLSRSRARARHLAVRAALGASRARLLTSAFFESAVPSVAGALLAVLVLALTEKVLRTILPPMLVAHATDVRNVRVLVFALLLAALSAGVTSVLPAWFGVRRDTFPALQGSTGTSRPSYKSGMGAVLALEAALGCVLVVGAVLAARSLASLLSDDLGLAPRDLYIVTATKPGQVGPFQPLAAYEQEIELLRRVSGVKYAGGADSVPPGDAPMRPLSPGAAGGRFMVTTDYLEALGTPIIAGRTFSAIEIQGRAAVAMLSQSAARSIWPDLPASEVVGRRWQPAGEPAREIVGIVDDVKGTYGETRSSLAAAYLPIGAEPSRFYKVAVRVEAGTTLNAAAVRATLKAQWGATRVDITYVPDVLAPYVRDPRFRAVLFGLFASTGLLLLVAGLYAMTTYQVGERRREMGIRLTLGATAVHLERLVIHQACTPAVIGAIAGLAVAYWLVRFAGDFLYKIDGRDPTTYASVLLVAILSTVLAAWIPARRAARLDPTQILRAE